MSRLRLVGISTSAVLVILAVALALAGGRGGGTDETTSSRLISSQELTELAGDLGHSIYWAGERSGAHLEVRQEAEGSVYLRYLPAGVEAGDPRQTFLTVGTYPVTDAQGALQRTAQENGAKLERLEDGAVVLPNPSAQGSVYLAYPKSDLEIEVYDPDPGKALELIRSGAIEPVGE